MSPDGSFNQEKTLQPSPLERSRGIVKRQAREILEGLMSAGQRLGTEQLGILFKTYRESVKRVHTDADSFLFFKLLSNPSLVSDKNIEEFMGATPQKVDFEGEMSVYDFVVRQLASPAINKNKDVEHTAPRSSNATPVSPEVKASSLEVVDGKDVFICEKGHASLRSFYQGSKNFSCVKCGRPIGFKEQGKTDFGTRNKHPVRLKTNPDLSDFSGSSPEEGVLTIWVGPNDKSEYIVKQTPIEASWK